MPMDPGRNRPAARICRQRLKQTEVVKDTRQLPPRPELQDAVPVGHVQGQRLPGGVVHHSIVPLEERRCVGAHRVATHC